VTHLRRFELRLFLQGAALCFGMGAVLDCHVLSPQLPQDLAAVEQCVLAQTQAGDTDVASIIAACGSSEETAILDEIAFLLTNVAFKGAHPKLAASKDAYKPAAP